MKYINHLPFDNGAILKIDYLFLTEFVKLNHYSTVLEFGPGTSTYAFLENDCTVYTVEYDPYWFNHYKQQFEPFPTVHPILHPITQKGHIQPIPEIESVHFHMTFVDSPTGEPIFSRYKTCLYASYVSNIFLLHDANRKGERTTLNVFQRHGWNITYAPTPSTLAVCTKNITVQMPR